MSSPNEAPSPEEAFDPTDAKIDSLLRDFFRLEVPASLPSTPIEAPDDWTTLTPSEARPIAKGSKWDFAGPVLLASVAVLLVCGLWMVPRPEKATQLTQQKLPAETGAPTVPAVWTPDVVGLPSAPTQVDSRSHWQNVKGGRLAVTITNGDSLVDLKYYSTSIGPVEQRTNVEWTTVRVWEPESGEWLEATVPAVRVEVVPLGQ
jgi:hypothetical protein